MCYAMYRKSHKMVKWMVNHTCAKGLRMDKKIKAKYTNGALMPLMPLDLEDGAEVTLSVEAVDELSLEERIKITKSRGRKMERLARPRRVHTQGL